VRGSSQETASRKNAENTVKHRDGGVGSVIANRHGGSESSVVVTTLQTTPRGSWSVSRDPLFNFNACNHISVSGTSEATNAKFCMQVEYVKCLAFDNRLLTP